MHDFETFAEEMKRQAMATLRAKEPDLAAAVLEQILAEAKPWPDHQPLKELAARIGAGVIAEYHAAGRLDGAESTWKQLHDALIASGTLTAPEARHQTAQCASNILMGRIASGNTRRANEAYRVLMELAQAPPHLPGPDRFLARAALRLMSIGLQLHPPQEMYDTYLPLRAVHLRNEADMDIARDRAKACLLLCVAFARGGDPDFARTLADELREIIDAHPDDPTMQDVRSKLDRVYSADA